MNQFTPKTEGGHTAEFVLSEAYGHRSRENATISASQSVQVGELLSESGGVYTPTTGTSPKGIALYAIDTATAGGSISIISRDAEVNGKLLVGLSTTTATRNSQIAALATRGIIVRDEGHTVV